jgi:serine/threonine protein kinase
MSDPLGRIESVRHATLAAGARMGVYDIVAPIGAGGMGEVYRAHDSKLGRDVAIKVLPHSFATDPDRQARFEREARLLAALNHSNIAQIYGLEESGGALALVMELVEGDTLADRIARGPIPIQDALPIARQIAEALAAAHEQGIIHRDLKPANVKVRPDGSVKVLDFGLAKWTEPTGTVDAMNSPTLSAGSTQQGLILGTAAYMSPEQASGQRVDRRTDLWSFGVVLFEMLTGRHAFEGETVSHVIAAVLKSEPDWSALPANTPAGVRRLLRRCLTKDPARRLESASDARLDLDEAMAEPAASGENLSARSISTPLWALAGIAALVAAGSIWHVSRISTTDATVVRRLVVNVPEHEAFRDSVGGPSITRDGSAIVYLGPGPHGSQLYYRRLSELESIPIPGTDGLGGAAISPSGEWIVAATSNGIVKIPVRGGSPIPLANVTYPCGATWGSDDVIYVAQFSFGPLLRIPANGGPPVKVATPRPGERFCSPFAPDADHVLISDSDQNGDRIALVTPSTGAVRVLDGTARNPIGLARGYLAFNRGDGTLGVAPFDLDRTTSITSVVPVDDRPYVRNSGMAATLSQTGDLAYLRKTNRTRLVLLDAQGQIIRSTSDDHNLIHPRISPDGRRIVAGDLSDDSNTSDLWMFDLTSEALQRLTTDGHSSAPEWLPDGRHIVYRHRLGDRGFSTGGDAWVMECDRGGSQRPLLSIPGENLQRLVVAPDSKHAIAIVGYLSRRLYAVDLDGKGQAKPLDSMASGGQMDAPAISGDGHWLAYQSNESGRDEIYVKTFPEEGPRVQISVNGGRDPRWTADSRGIVYRAGNEFLQTDLSFEHGVGITGRAKRLTFYTGVPHTPGDILGRYDVGPNGMFVALQPSSDEAQIVIVTNWIDDVKRRAHQR